MIDRLLLGGTPAPANIEYVASTSGYLTSTSPAVNVSLPSGLQQGDVILVIGHSQNSAGSTQLTPAGWSQVPDFSSSLWINYIVCGATPPTTYKVENQFGTATAWTAVAYRRARWAELFNVLDLEVSGRTGTSATPDPSNITTGTDGAAIIAVAGMGNNQTSMTPPTGFTTRSQAAGASASIQVAETIQSTAGVQTVDAFTFGTSAGWSAVTLAIRSKPRTTPRFVGFGSVTDYVVSPTVVTSTGTCTGADVALALPAVSNVEYSVDGGSTWFASGTLPAGQFSFQVRQLAPASWGGSRNATITIGGLMGFFSVTSLNKYFSDVNGSFTLPANIPATVNLVAVGGGGGGGGRSSAATGGSGGGAGGMLCRTTLTNAVAGDGLAFTIGNGGSAGTSTGTNGGAGGDTTMTRNGATLLVAKGGGGGAGNTGSNLAAGGTAAASADGTGTTKNMAGNGGSGQMGISGGYGGGGGGAGGYTGVGGSGQAYSQSGNAGQGGGGGGGSSNNTSKQYVGGGGGTGVLGAGTNGAGGGTTTTTVNGKGGSSGAAGSTLATGGTPGGGGGGNGTTGSGGAGGKGAIGIYW